MLKAYLHSTIIAIIQVILPMAAFVLLTPYFLNKADNLHKLQIFLSNWRFTFLMIHVFFCCGFIYAWPSVIKRLFRQQKISLDNQTYQKVLSVRWYLISVFMLLEILMLWR